MRRYTVTVDGTPFRIEIEETAADRFTVSVGERTFIASLDAAEDLPGTDVTPGLVEPPTPAAPQVPVQSRTPSSVTPASGAPIPGPVAPPAGPGIVAAPMPGVVLEVHVAVGAPVRRGDPLCVLEAMKMRNTIRAPRDGVVTAVHVEAGRPVMPGEPLVALDDAPR